MSALFSEAARQPPGVTLDDPIYSLDRATNEPPPVTPTGPPIWLGGQRRRGIELVARFASGWPLPGNRAGDIAYFIEKRDQIRRALETAGRDPRDFTFAARSIAAQTSTLAVPRWMSRARCNTPAPTTSSSGSLAPLPRKRSSLWHVRWRNRSGNPAEGRTRDECPLTGTATW